MFIVGSIVCDVELVWVVFVLSVVSKIDVGDIFSFYDSEFIVMEIISWMRVFVGDVIEWVDLKEWGVFVEVVWFGSVYYYMCLYIRYKVYGG